MRLLHLLVKKALLVLLAEKMLDLVAQAFLALCLFVGGSSTVASVFFFVDVAFAAALDVIVSDRVLIDDVLRQTTYTSVEVVVACSVAHGGLGDYVLGSRTMVTDGSDFG